MQSFSSASQPICDVFLYLLNIRKTDIYAD